MLLKDATDEIEPPFQGCRPIPDRSATWQFLNAKSGIALSPLNNRLLICTHHGYMSPHSFYGISAKAISFRILEAVKFNGEAIGEY